MSIIMSAKIDSGKERAREKEAVIAEDRQIKIYIQPVSLLCIERKIW